jgi:hypothetical protein
MSREEDFFVGYFEAKNLTSSGSNSVIFTLIRWSFPGKTGINGSLFFK